jgi:ATP/maltotriose-dependent transcriptional regulator MalT
LAAARASYEESLATRATLGDRRGLVMGRVELGTVQLAQGEIDHARRTAESALALAREIPLKPGEAQALYALGEIALASGDLVAARRFHEQALSIREEMKETRTILESRLALATLTLEEGRPAAALRAAHDIESELGTLDQTARIALAVLQARSALALGDVERASHTLDLVRSTAEKTEQIDLRELFVLVDAEVDAAEGQNARARARLATERPRLARAGMVLAGFEYEAARLRLDRVEGRSTFQAGANALQKDARTHGAGLILRRLQGP